MNSSIPDVFMTNLNKLLLHIIIDLFMPVLEQMRLSGQFQVCLFFFFYEKILNTQKHITNKNQLTKQKQANTKQ